MLSEPDYIHLYCMIQFPPTRFGKEDGRQIYMALCEEPGCEYEHQEVSDSGLMLARRRKGELEGVQSLSTVRLTGQTLEIQEEFPDVPKEEFGGKIEAICRKCFEGARIPLGFFQRVRVRVLVQPSSVSDSRQFVAERVLGLSQREFFRSLAREPSLVGMRLSFPPTSPGGDVLDVRVDSWRDKRRVWIQVESQRPLNPPVTAGNTQVLSENVKGVYTFLEGQLIPTLSALDG